ncbi:hypothetical protein BTHA_2707 [Burkholderia thailandensis MSMB59]|uniref:hypothetical protein n=1 Tax=Burkholderia TaxID=32008 RepID=UPI00051542A5|nr:MULTISPECIES: hypothetical protein [Burkholderia]AIS94747.1 hypothetical protein BTHA_2707 [Burkholderia thailandensis MSMB59]AOJ44858.1 hypothetical protein WJ27_06890 [Burkholderia thailandensis]KVG16628.1 hypothetical protein WJ28_12490 [Burkholderia thailandensis]MCA8073184.1 hypothetical protein [Burkholderia vietnamiensis]UKV75166.1 hypothetical protein FOC29_28065 [Burkholderia vietnamiensis]
MSENKDQPLPLELLIEARPEIMVAPTSDGKVEIIVNSMDVDSQQVVREEVVFPLECAEQVAEALIALAKRRK